MLIVCVALQEFKRLMQEADLGLSVNHIKLLYSQVRSCAATERAPQPKTECECGVQADVNEDGCIEYREFIPACVELIITLQQQRIAQMDKEENNIGRPGSVDEVARVVDFFAGPLGSFVSGEVLKVDGGVARL